MLKKLPHFCEKFTWNFLIISRLFFCSSFFFKDMSVVKMLLTKSEGCGPDSDVLQCVREVPNNVVCVFVSVKHVYICTEILSALSRHVFIS